MKTIKDTQVEDSTIAILYLCKLDYKEKSILVEHEIQFNNHQSALQAYSNIPNPESQLVTGKTNEGLIEGLKQLHINMKSKKWIYQLIDCI